MTLPGRLRGTALLALASLAVVPGALPAQNQRVEAVRTPDGRVLDFAPDGVWRVKARDVFQRRARLLTQGRFAELNAPRGDFNPPNVSGTISIPTILIAFKDTDTTTLSKAARYDSLLYGTVAGNPGMVAGRPYSLRTFYEEVSNGMFRVTGQTFGWAVVDSNQAYYLDACGSGVDPFSCDSGYVRAGRLFRQALTRVDPTVDFGLFDRNGVADTMPNSGDDDGVVDVVQFVQPVRGRECSSGPGYNAHRWSMSSIPSGGGSFITNDSKAGSGFVSVNSYYIVSGIGGTACNDTQPMAIGTSAHELGHGIGLPDLYDTNPNDSDDSEGVGEWGLMGSGNYRTIQSPAHFEAWSKQQMGWVTVRPLTSTGTYAFGPVVTSDTIFLIRPTGSNPRGEYLLLENKQQVGADTANMNRPNTLPKTGGLLVWHIDSTKIVQNTFLNTVNSGTIHGVALIQADGLNELRISTGGNRGNGGDPYPGSTNNTRLSYNSTPASTRNSDGTFVGFEIDSITQVVPNGQMRFKLRFGGATIVRASDTTAQVSVNGIKYRRFADILPAGSIYTIAIDSAQITTDSLTQFLFDSWSDAGARSHQITAQINGDSVSATVHKRFRVRATTPGGGTISSTPSGNVTAGVYVRKDSTFTLRAQATSPSVFAGWAGDTVTTVDSLKLTVSKPYTVVATFASPVVANAGTPPGGVMGKSYSHTLTATGGTGSYTWSIVSGNLPNGVTLSAAGAVTGIPSKTGSFNATARATSGPFSGDATVNVTVTAPALTTTNVVAHVLGTSTPLSADDVKYLDLLGNNNGSLDVGDFLAWVDATGAPAAAAVEVAAPEAPEPKVTEQRGKERR